MNCPIDDDLKCGSDCMFYPDKRCSARVRVRASMCCGREPERKRVDFDGLFSEYTITCPECFDYSMGRTADEAEKRWQEKKRLGLPK